MLAFLTLILFIVSVSNIQGELEQRVVPFSYTSVGISAL